MRTRSTRGTVAHVGVALAILFMAGSFNVINLHQPFVRAVYTAMDRITEPLYRPIRKILPDFGGLDFSPIILLLLIQVVSMLVAGAQNDLMLTTP